MQGKDTTRERKENGRSSRYNRRYDRGGSAPLCRGRRTTSLRVGIPRSLLYYKYHPMWREFLESVGCEVALSSPTSRHTVRLGTELGENDLCLPLKVFFGHAAALDEEVDALFVPRIVAVEKTRYTCPKFLGLPDLVRSLDLRAEVLGPTFNLRKGRLVFLREAYRLGRGLGAGRLRTVRAMVRALRAHRDWEHTQRRGGHLRRMPSTAAEHDGERLRIGVAGHPYNIYDEHVSLDLIRRLQERGCEVFTSETLTSSEIEAATERVPKGIFWSYENEIVGAIRHWIDHDLVDGIIYVLSFACGPDSFMQVVIEDDVRRHGNVPLLSLVIDEHSGEAGLLTRVEAFLDMLTRREEVPA